MDVVDDRERNETVDQDGKQFRRKYRQTETTHTLHGQQQHLADARRTELPTYQRSMPIRVRELCDVIPTWLEDRIDVVDGNLFRTDRAEEHLRTEVQSVLLEETEVFYHEDPAIVMGPFVLATWLCEEVDAEQHLARRQRQLRQQEIERQQMFEIRESYKPLAWGALLQVIPLTLQLVAISFWPSIRWPTIALSLLLLMGVAPWIRGVAQAHGAKPDASFYLIVTGVGVLGVLGLQLFVLAFCYATLSLFLPSLLFTLGSVFFLRELNVILQTSH